MTDVRADPAAGLAAQAHGLREAFGRYDERAVHGLLDAAFAAHRVAVVVDDLVFPFLRELGDAWERGEVSVAQEHWASGLVRGRLVGLASALAAGRPVPPRGTAVLACPTYERHDIGLLALDLVLRERGWDSVFLGADTPVDAAVELALDRDADVLVLCGSEPHMYDAQLEAAAEDLARLAGRTTIALAGRAATAQLAERHAGLLLPLSTVPAADLVDGTLRGVPA
ncbi:hypothetical protein GCM10011519_20860 [Marmoricola endophyticus]|uniref:B12-binding domain-containing protein n=1 Tax=Marmoricola endophyticus TaxID=2040280 RepID=A0A917BKF8_9ACTN|nr:B12-binding domain-containing protein [Marmoricola endophyticus]GGF46701.1 hypothetical protein GCM10011519_20860 [Marmoricola endophyticus]